MPFNAQLSFTGLGLVLLRSGGRRDPHPKAVELLLVRTPAPEAMGNMEHPMGESRSGHGGDHSPVEPHLPRLWFQLDDLAEPENFQFNDLSVGVDGVPVVELVDEIVDASFSITAEGKEAEFEVQWASDPRAVVSGPGAPLDAIDWIPDIEEQFGLSSIFLPEDPEAKGVYVTRVQLPPGKISTQSLFLNRDGSPAGWVFTAGGSQQALTPRRVLAERLIWSREGLTSLHIDLDEGLTFNASLREMRGEPQPATLRLALTNLPQTGLSGRFHDPVHFQHFGVLAKNQNAVIRDIRRDPPLASGVITSSGGCPPLRKEI
jgi:hypothetical protein